MSFEPEFPFAVYKSPGKHVGPSLDGASCTYNVKVVDDDAALSAALEAGWFLSLPEACDPLYREKAAQKRIDDEAAELEAAKALLAKHEEKARAAEAKALEGAKATVAKAKPGPKAKPDDKSEG
jgi:hypothetical protein